MICTTHQISLGW